MLSKELLQTSAPTIPTKVSELENDLGYITTTEADAAYLGKTAKANSAKVADTANSVAWNNVTSRPTIPTKTSQLTNDSGFLTTQQQADWNQSDSAQKDFIKNKPDLSVYATSKALTDGLAGKANTSHTHTIANVTNLQTTLNGKIPKTGNRGALAGYSTSAAGTTVDASAKDSQYTTSGAVTVKNGATGQAWTKVVKMSAGTVTLESNWAWVDGEVPELSFPCLLICHWNNDKGIAGVVKGAA